MARILVLVTSPESRERFPCLMVTKEWLCWWPLERWPPGFNLYKLGCFRVWDSEVRKDVLHLDSGVQAEAIRSRGGGLEYYLLKKVDDLVSVIKDNVLGLDRDGDDRAVLLIRGDDSPLEELRDIVNRVCSLCVIHGHELKTASHSNLLTTRYSSSNKAGPWQFMMHLRYKRGENKNRVKSFDRIWSMISTSGQV
jgi:hypothetical protein